MRLSDVDVDRLRRLQAAANKARHSVDVEARRAREKGATWTELGWALGISAQAAQKRYGTGDERSQAAAERAAARRIAKNRAAARKAAASGTD